MTKVAPKLESARAALSDANRQIGVIEAQRAKAILDEDDAAARKLDAELEELRRDARIGADRIKLLEDQARQEEAEAVVKRRADLVVRFEKKLQVADAKADELQATLAKAEQLFRKIITLRTDARAAWPLGDSHANAAAGTAEGAALSGAAVKRLLSWHLYRIGARPFLGGRPGEIVEESFPGAVCPRNEWRGIPENITPFADALRAASKFAVDMMRGKLDPLKALPPVSDAEHAQPLPSGNGETPDPVRTTNQERLAKLLKRQSELSEDFTPEGEAAYQQVVAEIATLQ